MNYYPHHIGDYASATAHLSMVEDCVYRRLIEWYYLDEKPLPTDRRAIYRRIRAAAESEREAVDVVLDEFFVIVDDGYRHHRCDEEIQKSKVKSDERREAANRRWEIQRAKELAEQSKQAALAHEADAFACAADAEAMHSQEPIANNQSKDKKKERARAPLPDWLPADAWTGYVEMRKANRWPLTDYGAGAIFKKLRQWLDDGHDIAAILDKSTMASYRGIFPPDDRPTRQSHAPPEGKYAATIAALTGRNRKPTEASDEPTYSPFLPIAHHR